MLNIMLRRISLVFLIVVSNSAFALNDIQPSFDCAKAKSKAELLICSDTELAKNDNEIYVLHKQGQALALDKKSFNDEAVSAWKQREVNCEDKVCLIIWYADRKEFYRGFINDHEAAVRTSKNVTNAVAVNANKTNTSDVKDTSFDKQNLVAIAIAGLLFFGFLIWKRHDNEKAYKSNVGKMVQLGIDIIKEHQATLVTRRKQTTHDRGYNLLDATKWQKEKEFFVNNVIKPRLGTYFEVTNAATLGGSFDREIDILTSDFQKSKSKFDAAMSPLQYEHFVADALNSYGWSAKTTVATGDQGVDVLAEKNGIKVAVQCKLYTNPVGNDAVQQVVTGKSFYEAQFAVVVSNMDFTRSARQIAKTHGVFLMHHDDLDKLDNLLGN